MAMPLPLLLLLLLLLLLPPSPAFAGIPKTRSSFSLDFFPGAGAGVISQLALSNAAPAPRTGAISMSAPHAQVQYRKPIPFVARAPAFSTYFSFSLRPSASLAFFLAPSSSPAPKALAVVFAAGGPNATSSHVRIDLAGRAAVHTAARGLPLARNPKLHSWIDYNATSATLQVRLAASRLPRPPAALLSYSPLHLSALLRRNAMVTRAGFASSANCSLFSWAFQAATPSPYPLHSQPLDPSDLLTTPPPERRSRRPYPWGAAVSMLFAAACGAMLTFLLLFAWYSVVARRPVAPVDPSDVVYEKIVLVGVGAKDVDAAGSGNKKELALSLAS